MIQHNDHMIERALHCIAAALREPEDITVTVSDYAPPRYRYMACEGEYDLGSTTGHGATPLAAIVDLLDQLD